MFDKAAPSTLLCVFAAYLEKGFQATGNIDSEVARQNIGATLSNYISPQSGYNYKAGVKWHHLSLSREADDTCGCIWCQGGLLALLAMYTILFLDA